VQKEETFMKDLKFSRSALLVIAFIVVVAATTGCIAPLPPPDPNNPIAKVAVLPMNNKTNDMEGPNWVRAAFVQMVPSRYYMVVSSAAVDQTLKDQMGVTIGGQLDFTNPGAGAPTPQKVGEVLGVDGLFYGTLEDFQNLITGFYNKRKVSATFKLVNAKTGQVVWEKTEEASQSDVQLSVSGALDAVKMKVAGAVINKALRANPLPVQTNQVISQFQRQIPSGPVATTAVRREAK